MSKGVLYKDYHYILGDKMFIVCDNEMFVRNRMPQYDDDNGSRTYYRFGMEWEEFTIKYQGQYFAIELVRNKSVRYI